MKHGFVMVGASSPVLYPADPGKNAQEINGLIDVAAGHDAKIIVFPELCLTGADCGDLFLQRGLTEAVESAVYSIIDHSRDLDILVFFGAPVWISGRMYNCALAVAHGKLLGVVPQRSVTNPRFERAPKDTGKAVVCGLEVPFGTDLLFESLLLPELRIAVLVGDDLLSPYSPASRHIAAGATVLAALTSTPVAAGDYIHNRSFIRELSSLFHCAIIRADAGEQEPGSHAHIAQNIIAENGTLLNEVKNEEMGVAAADIDVQLLDNLHLRRRQPRTATHSVSYFDQKPAVTDIIRKVNPAPFVWEDFDGRDLWCEDILSMQSVYLAKKAAEYGANWLVVPLDGNVGSTVAAFVCSRAAQKLGWENDRIIGVVSPCAGISRPTTNRASGIAKNMNLTYCMLDATQDYEKRLEALGIDAEAEPELASSIRRRVQISLASDIAEQTGGLLVLGEDMTDWALGKNISPISAGACFVNAGLAKTALRFVLIYIAAQQESLKQLYLALRAVIFESAEGSSRKQTLAIKESEQIIFTPLQMNDFFLYHILYSGFGPEKLFRLAERAFGNQLSAIRVYDCLQKFITRFCDSQLLRDGLPESPKLLPLSFDIQFNAGAARALWTAELEKIMPPGYDESVAEAEAEDAAQAILDEAAAKRAIEGNDGESRDEMLEKLRAAEKRAEAQLLREREDEEKGLRPKVVGVEKDLPKGFVPPADSAPGEGGRPISEEERFAMMQKRAEAAIAREREEEAKGEKPGVLEQFHSPTPGGAATPLDFSQQLEIMRQRAEAEIAREREEEASKNQSIDIDI